MAGYKIKDITNSVSTENEFYIPVYNTEFKKASIDTIVSDSIQQVNKCKQSYTAISEFNQSNQYAIDQIIQRNNNIYQFTSLHEGLYESSHVRQINIIDYLKTFYQQPYETVNVTITSSDNNLDLSTIQSTITYGSTTITKTGATFTVNIPSSTFYNITFQNKTGYNITNISSKSIYGEINFNVKYYTNIPIKNRICVYYKNSSNNTPVSSPPTCQLLNLQSGTKTGTYDTTEGCFIFEFEESDLPNSPTLPQISINNETAEDITMSNGYGIIVKTI